MPHSFRLPFSNRSVHFHANPTSGGPWQRAKDRHPSSTFFGRVEIRQNPRPTVLFQIDGPARLPVRTAAPPGTHASDKDMKADPLASGTSVPVIDRDAKNTSGPLRNSKIGAQSSVDGRRLPYFQNGRLIKPTIAPPTPDRSGVQPLSFSATMRQAAEAAQYEAKFDHEQVIVPPRSPKDQMLKADWDRRLDELISTAPQGSRKQQRLGDLKREADASPNFRLFLHRITTIAPSCPADAKAMTSELLKGEPVPMQPTAARAAARAIFRSRDSQTPKELKEEWISLLTKLDERVVGAVEKSPGQPRRGVPEEHKAIMELIDSAKRVGDVDRQTVIAEIARGKQVLTKLKLIKSSKTVPPSQEFQKR